MSGILLSRWSVGASAWGTAEGRAGVGTTGYPHVLYPGMLCGNLLIRLLLSLIWFSTPVGSQETKPTSFDLIVHSTVCQTQRLPYARMHICTKDCRKEARG
jgi:hypothetical protein